MRIGYCTGPYNPLIIFSYYLSGQQNCWSTPPMIFCTVHTPIYDYNNLTTAPVMPAYLSIDFQSAIIFIYQFLRLTSIITHFISWSIHAVLVVSCIACFVILFLALMQLFIIVVILFLILGFLFLIFIMIVFSLLITLVFRLTLIFAPVMSRLVVVNPVTM